MTAGNVPTTNLNAFYTNTSGGTPASPTAIDAAVQDIVQTVNDNYAYAAGLVASNKLSDMGIINVKDYGAKGDGTTDDTAAIQSAIDSLIETGGEVRFPAGIFKFSTSLTIPQGWPVELRGAGLDATILYYSGSDDAIKAIGTPENQIVKSGITNLRIEGNVSAQNAINIYCGYSFYMKNVKIDNFINGIRTQSIWKLTFNFVTITDCTGHAFFLKDESNQVSLLGCEAYNCDGAGLYTIGSRGVVALNCTFETNGYGVYITSDASSTSESVNIIGGYVEGNATNEIKVTKEAGTAPSNINISGVNFVCLADKASIGVRVDHVRGLTMGGNYISTGTATYGYSLYIGDGAELTNVTFGSNQDDSTNKVYQGTGTAYRNENKLIPKAWGRFTISGGAIDTVNSFNLESITYIGVGIYEITLREAMADTNYCIMATAENGASYECMIASASQPSSTTVFRLHTGSDASTLADARTVSFTVFE